jgi:hypothetical protein
MTGRQVKSGIVALVLLAMSAACAGLSRPAPPGGQPATAPRVILTVSVDWEGGSLRDSNLAALETLRRELPGVPFTHFLNGAYYTRSGAVADEVTAGIRRGLLPGDELGLHIHPYRSLVEAAGVVFREAPTFFGRPLRSSDGDAGHEVELTAYSVDELRKIVRVARSRLTQAGFAISRSFRAAGWIADAKVLEAIRAEGFQVDSSATDSNWHREELANRPLLGRIREVWPSVTYSTQPFTVPTAAGTILEMPDTGALADYVSAEEMSQHVKQALVRLGADRTRPLFVHIGLHQESAGRFAGRVSAALASVKHERDLQFLTLENAAALARALDVQPVSADTVRP